MVTRQRNITTPQVQVQSVDPNAGSAQKQIADFAFATAEVLADKAEKKFEMDFRNQAQEGINQAFETNQANPTQLNKDLQGLRSGLIKNAPRNLRDNFNESFESISRPFMNKATNNYGRVLNDQLKESSLQNIGYAKTALTRFSSDLLSGDPVVVADATAASQAKIMEVFSTVAQIDANGLPLFSASERVSISKKLVDEVAFSSVRDTFDDVEDKQDFLNRFEAGEIKASIFLDEQGAFVEDSISNRMDAASFERTRNYMESEIKSIKLASERVFNDRRKTLTEDSALFSLKYGGVQPNDYEGMIEVQRHNRVTEGNISILTNDDAKFKVNQLNGIQDTDTMIIELQKLGQSYGSDEVFDVVMRDLKKAGMSELVESTILMDPIKNRNVVDAAFQMAFNGKAYTSDSIARGVTASSIRSAVEDRIVDVREMIQAEGGEVAGVGRQMESIATFFTAQGKSVADATKLATDWFIDSAPAVSVNGYKTRVSGKEDVESIEAGLEEALRNVNIENTSIRIGTGAFTVSNIKRNARFVLDENTDTYFLKHETGGAVSDKEGNPMQFPVVEILRLSREKAEKERQAIAKKNLEKLQSGDF